MPHALPRSVPRKPLSRTSVKSPPFLGRTSTLSHHWSLPARISDNARGLGSEKQILRGIPKDIRQRLKGKRSIPISFIGPKTHLAMDSLEFSPAAMKDALQRGIQVAKEKLPGIEKALNS